MASVKNYEILLSAAYQFYMIPAALAAADYNACRTVFKYWSHCIILISTPGRLVGGRGDPMGAVLQSF